MGDDSWESLADGLYAFIIRYCMPSGMTPPDAWTVLRKYEKKRVK